VADRPVELPDIRPLRPEAYEARSPLWPGDALLVFHAREPTDFDWMEQMILRQGYYENEGVWSLELSRDKRAMAEIMAAFRPRRALELGCATGPVLHYLRAMAVECEGIEISGMAIERAFPDVRDRIHHGDLLGVDLAGPFELVFGLDVFEHLNPNRLSAYLARIAALLADGGYVYAALPAFGLDPVFGVLFPMYVRDWYQDVFLDRNFRLLHADASGYPLNGHLIWAHSRWWVDQFERHGLRREVAIERAVHERYDRFFDGYAPARKAFYVFSRNGRDAARDAVIDRVLSARSEALGESGVPKGAALLESDRVFCAGWHQVEGDPNGPFRWSQRRAQIRLEGQAGRRLSFLAFTEHPEVSRRPVSVRVALLPAGIEVARVSLTSREPVRLDLPITGADCRLDVAVDPAWVPRLLSVTSQDRRELGVGIRDVRLLAPGEAAPPAPVPESWARRAVRALRRLGAGRHVRGPGSTIP
jgi:SAM-dependent methyltransferase